MPRHAFSVSLAAFAIAAFAFSAAHAEDWPRFRGVAGDGISAETDWNPAAVTKGNVKWRKDIGLGYSTASVVGDKLYISGWKNGRDYIYCLNADTGEEVWSINYAADEWNKMHDGGPAGTPTIDDGKLYVMSRVGQLGCFDASNGEGVWAIDLRQKYDLKPPTWGFSGSAVIEGDVLYLDAGKILALNKKTGAEIWVTKDYGEAYSTPQLFSYNGKEYVAAFPEYGLVILERDTGKQVASTRWKTSYGVNAATPVIGEDGSRIFISSGYNVGATMYAFDGKSLNPVWETREMRNQMASSVWIGDFLYGFDEGMLKCLDANTGERVWMQRRLGKGALSAADGKLIIQSEGGELVIAEATPENFKELSRADVMPGAKRCWIMPVLSNGTIYCRGSKGELVAVDVSK